MKRVIALLLALVLALSLCACGGEAEKPGTENTPNVNEKEENPKEETPKEEPKEEKPREPTAEELELLKEYNNICKQLAKQADGGVGLISNKETGENWHGEEILPYCYRRLTEMSSIDHWIAQGKNLQAETPRDRQKVLDNFIVVEDVLLSSAFTTVDYLGNHEHRDFQDNVWTYDAEGRVATADINQTGAERVFERVGAFRDYLRYPYSTGYFVYEYDEGGSLKTVTQKSGSSKSATIEAIYVPIYDEAGNLISHTIRTNSGEEQDQMVRAYDSAGRVTAISLREDGALETEVRYDEAGRITEYKYTDLRYISYEYRNNKVHTPFILWTAVYTYEGDVLKSKTVTRQDYDYKYDPHENMYYDGFISHETVDTVEVECDELGRVVKETTTFGEKVELATGEKEKPVLVSQIVEYTYGDFFIYTPAE